MIEYFVDERTGARAHLIEFISSIHIRENGIISKDGWFNRMLPLPAHNRHSVQPDCLLFLFIAVCHSIILLHVFFSRSLFISNFFFSLSLENFYHLMQSTKHNASSTAKVLTARKLMKQKGKMIKNRNYVLLSVIYCWKWRCIDENSGEKSSANQRKKAENKRQTGNGSKVHCHLFRLSDKCTRALCLHREIIYFISGVETRKWASRMKKRTTEQLEWRAHTQC